MTQLPTVKHLRYLAALAEHRHFGRAAGACHVSQSAFSLAIQELEGLLGANLVDRTSRRVTVTAIGQEAAERARRILDDLASLVEAAGRTRGPLTGPLRLGAIPTIAPFLLPRVLPGLKAEFPQLELYLAEETTARLHAELLAGKLDLILVALPFELREVETLTLFRDRFRLACREGTQLLDPARYSPGRLPAESLLLLEEGHCMREHAIEACRIKQAEKVSRFAATSLFTLLQMVEADLGVTFLPEMAEGSPLLAGTHIRTWPLGEKSHRAIALGWRRGSGREEEFRVLGEAVKALYQGG